MASLQKFFSLSFPFSTFSLSNCPCFFCLTLPFPSFCVRKIPEIYFVIRFSSNSESQGACLLAHLSKHSRLLSRIRISSTFWTFLRSNIFLPADFFHFSRFRQFSKVSDGGSRSQACLRRCCDFALEWKHHCFKKSWKYVLGLWWENTGFSCKLNVGGKES